MDQRTSLEMTEMERRTFLRSMALSAAFLLETPFPTSKPGLLSAEQLAVTADRLTQLRALDDQKGSFAVVTDAAELAESLLRWLKTTPEAEPLRRRLALLTGQAARLAEVTAYHVGEPGPALSWARVVEVCGRQARSPDLAAWGVVCQSEVLREWDSKTDRALEVMHRAPRDGLSAPVRAKLEMTRALAAAASSHPLPRRERWTRTALERSHDASRDVGANPSELPFAYWVSANHLTSLRGHCYLLLGYGDAAYEMVSESVRDHPADMHRNLAGKHVTLARAAILGGDVDRACAHAVEAHTIMSEAPSALFAKEVREFRDVDLAPFADSAAVRQLEEQLSERRTTAVTADETPARPKRPRRQYFKVYGRDGTWRLHMADCTDGLRARKRHPFPLGNGRRPERLAANPQLRPGVVPCERCIGPLWS